MTTKQIREKIENLVDLSTNQTLKETNAIKHIGIDNDKNIVILIIDIHTLGGEAEAKLRRELAKIIKLDLGFSGIRIQFEEARNMHNVAGKNTKFIIVASGKGGVGKSTVAINLGYALTKLNKKVGIVDADIYGSSIPTLLEMPTNSIDVNEKNKIIPFNIYGMEVISTSFFQEEGQPVLWRGSLLNSMLNNFFYQVEWSKNLDYIIIDMGPGTGDALLDICEIIKNGEVLLVTTPNILSKDLTMKTGKAFLNTNHNIIGIIENMAYNENTKEKLWNESTDKFTLLNSIEKELNTEVLATLPFAIAKHHLALYEEDEECGKIYKDIALLISIR